MDDQKNFWTALHGMVPSTATTTSGSDPAINFNVEHCGNKVVAAGAGGNAVKIVRGELVTVGAGGDGGAGGSSSTMTSTPSPRTPTERERLISSRQRQRRRLGQQLRRSLSESASREEAGSQSAVQTETLRLCGMSHHDHPTGCVLRKNGFILSKTERGVTTSGRSSARSRSSPDRFTSYHGNCVLRSGQHQMNLKNKGLWKLGTRAVPNPRWEED